MSVPLARDRSHSKAKSAVGASVIEPPLLQNSTLSSNASGARAAKCRRQISGEFPISMDILYSHSPFIASWQPNGQEKGVKKKVKARKRGHSTFHIRAIADQ
ncbi:MAG: hypothetical protein ABSF29_14935 [Tepidisphaeraceae bacterium]